MQKSIIASVLGEIISTLGLVPPVEGTPSGGCKISLKQLYPLAGLPFAEAHEFNFLEMTDGTILFFDPRIRYDLRSVMANHTEAFKANFLIFFPPARISRVAPLTVRKRGNTLLFDAYTAKDSEIDRTMFSPAWANVFAFCKTLYINTDPRNVRVGNDPNGVSCSGFTRLPNGHFLISGGMSAQQYPDKASLAIPSTATVYDSSSNSVVKSFRLCQDRARHLSLLLPDGKVLLVGSMGSTSIELVDPEALTSRLLNCQLKYRFGATACVDGQGNCLVLGGYDSNNESTGLVERIDIRSETIKRIGDLEIPRSFGGMRLNAIALPDRSILVSGGSTRVWWNSKFAFNREDAEMITFDK